MNDLVGVSAWAQQLRAAIDRVARFRSSILITGDSGTGKELIARAIHRGSPRSAAPLVCVDCASIPASLFASTLFGHVKGAFSGADYDALGCFRAADGGTIFLDEIGELNLDLQSQLLRVLQQREVIPVGSHRGVPVDIRIVAATNRALEVEVSDGRFRRDLFYRLNVVRLETVPLAQRKADIPALSEHFLACLTIENGLPRRRLSAAALAELVRWDWPGNVRELQNVLERLVVFSPTDTIAADLVRSLLRHRDSSVNGALGAECNTCGSSAGETAAAFGDCPPTPASIHSGEWHVAAPLPTLSAAERELIERALRQTHFNQSAAARILDVDRKLLARKIRKYQIRLPGAAHANGARSVTD